MHKCRVIVVVDQHCEQVHLGNISISNGIKEEIIQDTCNYLECLPRN